MKTLYEKRIKKLEDSNLALHKTTRNLKARIFWLTVIFLLTVGMIIVEELL